MHSGVTRLHNSVRIPTPIGYLSELRSMCFRIAPFAPAERCSWARQVIQVALCWLQCDGNIDSAGAPLFMGCFRFHRRVVESLLRAGSSVRGRRRAPHGAIFHAAVDWVAEP